MNLYLVQFAFHLPNQQFSSYFGREETGSRGLQESHTDVYIVSSSPEAAIRAARYSFFSRTYYATPEQAEKIELKVTCMRKVISIDGYEIIFEKNIDHRFTVDQTYTEKIYIEKEIESLQDLYRNTPKFPEGIIEKQPTLFFLSIGFCFKNFYTLSGVDGSGKSPSREYHEDYLVVGVNPIKIVDRQIKNLKKDKRIIPESVHCNSICTPQIIWGYDYTLKKNEQQLGKTEIQNLTEYQFLSDFHLEKAGISNRFVYLTERFFLLWQCFLSCNHCQNFL